MSVCPVTYVSADAGPAEMHHASGPTSTQVMPGAYLIGWGEQGHIYTLGPCLAVLACLEF